MQKKCTEIQQSLITSCSNFKRVWCQQCNSAWMQANDEDDKDDDYKGMWGEV